MHESILFTCNKTYSNSAGVTTTIHLPTTPPYPPPQQLFPVQQLAANLHQVSLIVKRLSLNNSTIAGTLSLKPNPKPQIPEFPRHRNYNQNEW